MSIGRVWSRFGRIRKLRIQDMPKDRGEEVTEIFLRYYVTSEPFHRATNTARCPETLNFYENYGKSLSDPNFSCVICCPDDSDEVTDIMGISTMSLIRKYNTSEIDKCTHKPSVRSKNDIKYALTVVRKVTWLPRWFQPRTKEWETFYAICKELYTIYNPMEQYNVSSFYDDRGMVVLPEYRGLGIAGELVKSRRLICEAQDVPMTGAWAVSTATEIAGVREGWETAVEVSFEELGKRHGVVFTDVPTTLKYMIAKV